MHLKIFQPIANYCKVAFLFLSVFAVTANSADKYVFGINSLDSTLSIYELLDQGAVKQHSYYPTAQNPKAVLAHPNGKYVFVISKPLEALVSYPIDTSNGLQLEMPTPYKIPAKSPFAMALHPNGRFLYVAAREGKIAAFSIDEQSGELRDVPGSPFKSQDRTRSLTIHPGGEFLYAVNAYSNSVTAYRVEQSSGALKTITGSPYQVADPDAPFRVLWAIVDVPEKVGGIPYYIAITPNGKFLYVTNWALGKVTGFAVDQAAGTLTPLPGSPYDTGLHPFVVAVHPSGKYLHVGSWEDDSIWAYEINQVTGRIKPLDKKHFSGGMKPVHIAYNKKGNKAYVSNYETASIGTMHIDTTTGELSLIYSTQTRPGPWALSTVLESDAQKQQSAAVYSFNDKTRKLSKITVDGSTADSMRYSQRVGNRYKDLWVIHPNNRFAYFAGRNAKTIAAYTLQDATLKLQKSDPPLFNLPGNPVDMKMDANGWYLYVTTEDPNMLAVYEVNPDNGTLTAVRYSPRIAKLRPGTVAIDPLDRFAYVLSEKDSAIAWFGYRQNTGPLVHERTAFGSPFKLNFTPDIAWIDPAAAHLLVRHKGSKALSVYKIDPRSGALKALPGSPLDFAHEISNILFHQSGKHIYIQDNINKQLHHYSRDNLTGKILGDGDVVATYKGVKNAIVSIQNHQAAIVDGQSGDLKIYSIDTTTGKFQLSNR